MNYQPIHRHLKCSVLLFCFTLAAARGQSVFISLDNHTVVTLPSDGSINTEFASFPDGDPTGLALDKSGNLFASDSTLSTIVRLTPEGASSIFASNLSNPAGLAFDTGGNLYVANSGEGNDNPNSILKFAPNGSFTVIATLDDGINQPEGLAFDTHGNLFVANFGGTISKITPVGTVSTFASGLGAGLFGLAIDNSDNVFASILFQNRITKITPDGSSSLFLSGSGLNSPAGLAFDGSGNLYAANNGSGNIMVFTPGGASSVFTSDLPSTPEFLTLNSPAAVPEPAEYAVFAGLAVLSLAAWRCRRS